MPEKSAFTRREFVVTAGAMAAAAAVGGEAARGGEEAATQARREDSALSRPLSAPVPLNPAWPVLTRYDEAHLTRLAMPLGGIGTGTISLGGRGDLRDWELVNKPAKGYAPPNTFFALYAKPAGGPAVARALEGPLDPVAFEGASGSPVRNHGLPRFRQCNFAAAYPIAQVLLADPDVPVKVRLEAFNPMVPADPEISGIPVAILRFVLINPASENVAASICGTVENFIGWDGDSGKTSRNFNEFREKAGWPVRGLFMQSGGIDPKSPAFGTLALTTTAQEVSHRTAWAELSWGDSLLDFWDDFSADGTLDARDGKREPPFGSLAASTVVPANGSAALTFLITWHFPNRLSWTPPFERIGNWYTKQYSDAWDAAVRAAQQLPELERRTIEFVGAYCQSDIPGAIKEAALANASTLRTQTAFRADDGNLYGWEGCNDHGGCCHGSCTHVWNYEHATAFLYGSLARTMRDVEFGHATRDNGFMSFRVNLPLIHAQEARPAAADGQMGTLMKLYREWRMSGDESLLKRLWPHAKKALEFAWIPGGWDANRDGVMEGCQHNTMDVEYYGPNPEIGGWYLGALRAAEEMASHAGDDAFARTCHDLWQRGRDWLDANLFNGEYYEHRIVPPADPKAIADGLRLGAGAADPTHPDLQVGAGCLADQLVGQLMAHVTGLGYLLNPQHVRATLASILKYNYLANFFGQFNPMRSYALGDESGLLVASYPRNHRPDRPFPYANEVWTGLEYTAAAGMIYEGMIDEGLRVISAVRDRHDGRKRNPFDEPECGHHYARAMASWAAVIAYTGFRYDGTTGTIHFRASDKPATWFWSSGDAWGTVCQEPSAAGTDVSLRVVGSKIRLEQIMLEGVGSAKIPDPAGKVHVERKG